MNDKKLSNPHLMTTPSNQDIPEQEYEVTPLEFFSTSYSGSQCRNCRTIFSPMWIVGAEARLLWWAIAAGLDTIGRWLAHPVPGRRLQSENIPFDAGHMLERCRLFLLITLGETVFTTGTAIASAPMTLVTLVTGTLALAGTVALWALAFGSAGHLALQYAEETRDHVRASRHAVNVLVPMVAGLIPVAVVAALLLVGVSLTANF